MFKTNNKTPILQFPLTFKLDNNNYWPGSVREVSMTTLLHIEWFMVSDFMEFVFKFLTKHSWWRDTSKHTNLMWNSTKRKTWTVRLRDLQTWLKINFSFLCDCLDQFQRYTGSLGIYWLVRWIFWRLQVKHQIITQHFNMKMWKSEASKNEIIARRKYKFH